MLTFLAGAEDATSTDSSWLSLLLPALLIGVAFYFLMIRPQRTRLRRHEQMIASLAVGDEVTTIGGIYGTIEYLDDRTAVLQVEGGGRLRVARRALAGKVTD